MSDLSGPEFLIRLLKVAADYDDLDPDDLEFAVISGKAAESGWWPFDKGEIIVLPKEDFREPFGQGRKTSKWSVSEERFGRDWEAAKRRSDEVKAAPDFDPFSRRA